MDTFIQTFFNFDIMAQAFPLLLKGAVMTLKLCAVVIVFGLAGGVLEAEALSRRDTHQPDPATQPDGVYA